MWLRMRKKVNEIFYSLQGEGYHTGTPAVFVRLSGCNLSCPFCDTRHDEGVMMTDDEIVEACLRHPARVVVVTGGEPSLQLDDALVNAFHSAGFRVHVETNGTMPLPASVDWVTCSPKTGGEVVLTHIDELKVVYEGQDLSQYDCYDAAHRFLQPCSCLNTDATIAAVLAHPAWRLSLQTHKLVGIR